MESYVHSSRQSIKQPQKCLRLTNRISVFCLFCCGCQGKGWIWAGIFMPMIAVHFWCFEYNPPLNISGTLTLIKCMQTKQQLVVTFIFPFIAPKKSLGFTACRLCWQEPGHYIRRRKVLVFITWIKAGLSVTKSKQCGQKSGWTFLSPKECLFNW